MLISPLNSEPEAPGFAFNPPPGDSETQNWEELRSEPELFLSVVVCSLMLACALFLAPEDICTEIEGV